MDKTKSNIVRLALLLGRDCLDNDEENATGLIADALGIVRDSRQNMLAQSWHILFSRGETELADLIQCLDLSVDDYINDMGRLFKA